jgi:adenylylsulfate kinase-like enzyme
MEGLFEKNKISANEHGIFAPMIIWLTGLPGAGKSTIGRFLVEDLNCHGSPTIFLDGDELREVLGATSNFTRQERVNLGITYSKFCKLLNSQGFNVVCATVSMFDEVYEWQQKNLDAFKRVVFEVSEKVLISRDQKKLYSNYKNGYEKNLPGFDLYVDYPRSDTLWIDNDGERTPKEIVSVIKKFLHLKEVTTT